MFIYKVTPGFSDTDALGHINNTRLPVWFENAREPIFRFFTPDLDTTKWELILASIKVDFHAQLYMNSEIEVRSWISHLGNKSFHVTQQAWQNGKLAASGVAAMVHFDYNLNLSTPIPDKVRVELDKHVQDEQS